jgi:hypothetical protein
MRHRAILVGISLLFLAAAHAQGDTNEISAATLTNLISFLHGHEHAYTKFHRAEQVLRPGSRLPATSSSLLANLGCMTNGNTLTYSLMELDLQNEAYWIRLDVDRTRNVILKLDCGGFQRDPQPATRGDVQ